MARKRRKRKHDNDFPGWVWMLFGLAIGLAVALAIYLREPDAGAPPRVARTASQPTAKEPPAAVIDNNGESATAGAMPEQRFTFYDMLPTFEVEVPDEGAEVTIETQPRAVTEPGVYVLQAGSFSRYEDADRRRAQLALQGIESEVVPYRTPERTLHRVRIGPVDDLDKLNVLRSRLRQANIDVLRIRLGDK